VIALRRDGRTPPRPHTRLPGFRKPCRRGSHRRKPCPVLGERVHAFVVLRHAVGDEDLTRHCASLLSDTKAPEAFHRLADTLPPDANGKALKRDLRQTLVA
jgi:acyl-CoA synthetase (AMP-forming)/AMP-acid ligase II